MTTKGFFIELQRIIDSQPRPETRVMYSENCNNSNLVFDSKNLEYCFDTTASSDSVYLFDCHLAAQSADCDYTVESESCYECMDVLRCFNCSYIQKADNVRDSMYCYDLSNCHDLFGCSNLKNKSYCIFNRQFTKEEYEEKVKVYKSLPSEKVLEMLEELKIKYPITQSSAERNINSPYGDQIYNCKNCYMSFDASQNEDCCYMYDSFKSKICMDMTYASNGCEGSYQIIGSVHIFNSGFIQNSDNCQDSFYLFDCKGVKNSIGCVGLEYKQYCILNRQFTKEEYEKISNQILSGLKNDNPEWNSLVI